MEKVRLGKTEMMVSRVGFGGIPIQRVSEDEAIAVVERCLDLGINFIDTANSYTTSEERIGKAISERREGLVLATKSGSRESDGVKGHLQQSLKQLGVESIDLYQFHNVSDFGSLNKILAPDGPLAVVQEAKQAGLVRHIGITSHQIDAAKEAVKSGCFETIMFPFNFVTYELAEELLPLAREYDVGFIAMKPLDAGMLDNATIAFKYLFQFPDVVPIPGIEKTHEIEEIVQIMEGQQQMTEAEKKEMQRLREELGTKLCRRSDYCLPCPEGIPISLVMDLPGIIKTSSPQHLFAEEGFLTDVMAKAANCTECGECEGRCPYHLPIIELIAENLRMCEMAKKKYQKEMTAE